MPTVAQAGTRIRERRLLAGMRQADLARAAGISASYLNLIEHNRRRVGAALLDRLAGALGVTPVALGEGAEAALIDGVRAAVAETGSSDAPPAEPLTDFVARFPGWAGQMAALGRRARTLEATVERLSDRMAHDPYLSDALHEVLSAVTALRSTSAILAETEDIDPDWRARFHGNLHADAVRLSDVAEALAAYLDGSRAEDSGLTAPLEELETWRAAIGYHLPEVEAGGTADARIAAAPELASGAARRLAADWAARYAADAAVLPLGPVQAALAEARGAPGPVAARFGTDLATVLRRMACLPGSADVGLLICDGSGTLTLRKGLDGFEPPHFGAGCPLWPLYRALAEPMRPIEARIELAGRLPRRFDCIAIGQPRRPPLPGAAPLWEATMLIRPANDVSPAPGGSAPWPVGTGCRVCPRADCAARREPSILAER